MDEGSGDSLWQPESTLWLNIGMWLYGFLPSFAVPFLGAWLLPFWLALGLALVCFGWVACLTIFVAWELENPWEGNRESNVAVLIGGATAVAAPTLGLFLGNNF